MRSYIALIHKEPTSDFGVSFPDLPGCVTAGSSLDEARAMAEEALAGHLEVMREYGEEWPEPSTLEAVMADRENRDAVAFMVPVDNESSKVVRVNITLPEIELKRIDKAAEAAGCSRSGFLLQAARRATGAADSAGEIRKPVQTLRKPRGVAPLAEAAKERAGTPHKKRTKAKERA